MVPLDSVLLAGLIGVVVGAIIGLAILNGGPDRTHVRSYQSSGDQAAELVEPKPPAPKPGEC